MLTHVNFKRVSKIDRGNAWEFVRKRKSSLSAFMHFLFCIHARKFLRSCARKNTVETHTKSGFLLLRKFYVGMGMNKEMKSSSMFLFRAI